MKIFLNDHPRDLPVASTLGGLLRELGLGERKGIAVAVNQAVVPRVEWTTRVLCDGERVLVIQATQGG